MYGFANIDMASSAHTTTTGARARYARGRLTPTASMPCRGSVRVGFDDGLSASS